MEAKAINLNLTDNLESKTDNEFENFLWKRAKTTAKKREEKQTSSDLLNMKKNNLTVNQTVNSISSEIEEYMVDYLKLMEFSKSHSQEISQFFAKNLKNVK